MERDIKGVKSFEICVIEKLGIVTCHSFFCEDFFFQLD